MILLLVVLDYHSIIPFLSVFVITILSPSPRVSSEMIQRRSLPPSANHTASDNLNLDIEGGVESKSKPFTYKLPNSSRPSAFSFGGLPPWLLHLSIKHLAPVIVCCVLASLASAFLFESLHYFVIIWSICLTGLCFSLWLFGWCLNKDTGTSDMQDVSNPIREGAESFLSVQYRYIAKISGFAMAFIFLSYKLRQPNL